jgi:hypothetical protein
MIVTRVGSSWIKSCFYEKFEDTKGVIRSNNSKDRQYNGQKKKHKQ